MLNGASPINRRPQSVIAVRLTDLVGGESAELSHILEPSDSENPTYKNDEKTIHVVPASMSGTSDSTAQRGERKVPQFKLNRISMGTAERQQIYEKMKREFELNLQRKKSKASINRGNSARRSQGRSGSAEGNSGVGSNNGVGNNRKSHFVPGNNGQDSQGQVSGSYGLANGGINSNKIQIPLKYNPNQIRGKNNTLQVSKKNSQNLLPSNQATKINKTRQQSINPADKLSMPSKNQSIEDRNSQRKQEILSIVQKQQEIHQKRVSIIPQENLIIPKKQKITKIVMKKNLNFNPDFTPRNEPESGELSYSSSEILKNDKDKMIETSRSLIDIEKRIKFQAQLTNSMSTDMFKDIKNYQLLGSLSDFKQHIISKNKKEQKVVEDQLIQSQIKNKASNCLLKCNADAAPILINTQNFRLNKSKTLNRIPNTPPIEPEKPVISRLDLQKLIDETQERIKRNQTKQKSHIDSYEKYQKIWKLQKIHCQGITKRSDNLIMRSERHLENPCEEIKRAISHVNLVDNKSQNLNSTNFNAWKQQLRNKSVDCDISTNVTYAKKTVENFEVVRSTNQTPFKKSRFLQTSRSFFRDSSGNKKVIVDVLNSAPSQGFLLKGQNKLKMEIEAIKNLK